ncbi:YcjF family protein [Shewanella halifaxensis]|nr:GTPase [Shewanella halifaxensis]
MVVKISMLDQIKEFINPSKNPDLSQAHEFQRKHLPTLWLIGKTGAGKSSFIQAVTGHSSIEVGNGYAPCTMTAEVYEFPQDKPVMRFLDTRGLGEADYNPNDDLEEISESGNSLVVVMKVDESEQSSVLEALKQIKKKNKIKHLLLVHSAVLLSGHKELERQITFNEKQVKGIWGKDFDAVAVDFEAGDGSVYNYDALIEKLTKILPVIGMMIEDKERSTIEEENFDKVENEVLWYAGSASASDLIPAVGLVSVPAIQAKMLHSLANQYGVEWSTRTFSELIGTLGSSFALQYGVKLGARQLVKFVPGYGQTVGAVTAAGVSFGTTYGLGRAACFYFYHKSKGETVSKEGMQSLYKDSFYKGKAASGYE